MSKCFRKYTVPQVPDKHWQCPVCGARTETQDPLDKSRKIDGWVITDSVSPVCDLLHVDDGLSCGACAANDIDTFMTG